MVAFLLLLIASTSSSVACAQNLRGRFLQQQASGPCVCVFDFDNTLRVGGDTPGRDAAGVVSACKTAGYKIAIASGNDNYHKLKKVLQGMLGDIFSDSFLSSPAFQIGQGHKTYSLKHIGEYYSSPGPCMVLYDDTAYNKRYADEYGSSFQKVDPSKGVTYSDYSAGVQQVNNKCRCTGVSQSGVATSG